MPNLNHLYACILVGGKGKRLRPLSTNAKPKAFLSVTRSGRSMLGDTLNRVRKIVPQKNIIIAANKAHAHLIRKEFRSLKNSNLVLEPVSRNTAPAIARIAAILLKRDKEATVIVLPADHYITGEKKHDASLKKGMAFAKNGENLVVFGLEPTFASTQFGYIRLKNKVPGTKGVYEVKKFTEKPNAATAKKFVRDGRYLWNLGMFAFRADTMLDAFMKHAPAIYNKLKDLDKVDKTYKRFPDISIDYCIMEKSRNIFCVKSSYIWQDIGSFDTLREVLNNEGRKYKSSQSGRITKIY